MFFLKCLSQRTLFSLTQSSSPSLYCLFVAKCSTSSPSPLPHTHAHSHPNPRNVRVSVWWDHDTCRIPFGVNPFRVAQTIIAALNGSGIHGAIQITAFGDGLRLSKTNHWSMTNTGIVIHDTQGVNGSTDNLRTDLNNFVLNNPAPGHIFVISDDIKLTKMLRFIRNEKYNILLASNESSSLMMYSTIFWLWDDLVTGKSLNRRYFNQPPVSFWYGRIEGHAEDPSTTTIKRPVLKKINWCDNSFWMDMKTLINTDKGSYIIAESSSRENMSYYLQEYGPSVLKSVPNSDVLYMVGMLISKRLVHEKAFLIKPFEHPDSVKKSNGHDGKLQKKIKKLQKVKAELERKLREAEKKNDELNGIIENMCSLPNGSEVFPKESGITRGFPSIELLAKKSDPENKDSSETEDDDDDVAADDQDDDDGNEEEESGDDGEGGADPEDEPDANGDGASDDEEEEGDDDDDEEEDEDDDIPQPPTKKRK